ncbi:MAG: carboxylesterase family protein [Alistipes sp.]
MMKKLLVIFALLASYTAVAQPIEKNTALYSVKETDSLYMDRYCTQGETLTPAPCMIFVFGGGFMTGARDDARYIPFFEYIARQGVTVISIDYRLGLKKAAATGKLNQNTFIEAWFSTLAMAEEDLYDATNYLLTNATAWNIDPTKIITCGSSAGAITVLHGEYDLCRRTQQARKLPAEFNYAGVISFAGAIFALGDELNWGTAHTPAPMLLFHGDADRNVPYHAIREMGAGFFGSEYISKQLTANKVAHSFYSFTNTDHIVALAPMNENRYEIDSFLEKLVFEHRPLITRTEVRSLDKPTVKKEFTLTDYIQSNFAQ